MLARLLEAKLVRLSSICLDWHELQLASCLLSTLNSFLDNAPFKPATQRCSGPPLSCTLRFGPCEGSSHKLIAVGCPHFKGWPSLLAINTRHLNCDAVCCHEQLI